jgi:hypothetical protein
MRAAGAAGHNGRHDRRTGTLFAVAAFAQAGGEAIVLSRAQVALVAQTCDEDSRLRQTRAGLTAGPEPRVDTGLRPPGQ